MNEDGGTIRIAKRLGLFVFRMIASGWGVMEGLLELIRLQESGHSIRELTPACRVIWYIQL
jgi:hypothetical protein